MTTSGDVLVAGAAGFIGCHLCGWLIEKGYKVVGVDNLVTGKRENVQSLFGHPKFRFIESDVTKPISPPPVVEYIIHLASPASPIDYTNLPIETLLVNSIGTYRLLELAKDNGARFIMGSTSEAYGDPKEHPQKESYWGNVNPVGPRSCYDEGKRFSEALTMSYYRKYGLSIGIARIFNTYGPSMRREDGRVIPNFITQALSEKPITIYGDGKQTRSFCYISDMVAGLYSLMSSDKPGPINLGNPNECTVLEIAGLIKELTNSSSPLCFLPLPTDDPTRRRPDISKAKALLDWEPAVGSEEGLKRTIEFFKKNL